MLVALLAVAITGVSLLLAALAGLSAWRLRSWQFLAAAGAFGAFALKGLWIILDGQGWAASPFPWNGWTVGLDALILGFLYVAIVQR